MRASAGRARPAGSIYKVFALIAVCMAAWCLLLGDGAVAGAQTDSDVRPNIVLILTDDMRADDLNHMPQTRQLIAGQGMTFENAFVTNSLCCPSRASILRGQYVHNHRIEDGSPPNGGFSKFHDLGHEDSTVATWLKDGGYRTVLVGKYLNGYPTGQHQTYIPPGWDEWYAVLRQQAGYYDYDLSENGDVVHYGSDEQDYLTDVLARKAKDYVQRTAADATPFFMYLAPTAPHGPFTVAPRHEGLFREAAPRVPRSGSFDEWNVSDKPAWIRTLSGMTEEQKTEADQNYRKRLRMLQSADEMVASLVGELEAAGKLENTYIFFASDHGFQLGEHRIQRAKMAPYEESVRVPLVARGPGIPAGRTTNQFALNTDFAPTFADLAGVGTPEFVDGRSLKPLFTADATAWRTGFMLEHYEGDSGGVHVPRYDGIRTTQHKYVEYPGSRERELYDLAADPYETQSVHATITPSVKKGLRSRLLALRRCAGDSCRTAEDGQ